MKMVAEIVPDVKKSMNTYSGEPESVTPDSCAFAPASLDDLEVTHPKMKNVVSAVREWARCYRDGNKMSFVMVGPNGVGKTHITRAILWSIKLVEPISGQERPAGRMYTAYSALKMLTESSPASLAPVDNYNPSRSTPFVIIDDIGAEHDAERQADWSTAMVQAQWFRLVDYCDRRKVPLILSASNNAGTLAGIRDHIGPRCWDRILKMAPSGFIWDLSGVPSYRVKSSGRQ